MDYFSFHESKQHGSPEFPFSYFYVNKEHPRHVMPHHWHKEWEIIHVIKGSFCATLNDRTLTAQEGDVFLVRDGMLHSGIPQDDCVYECFLFDLHRLFQFSESAKKHLRPVYRKQILPALLYPACDMPQIKKIAEELSDVCRKHQSEDSFEPFELFVLSFISQFFATMIHTGQFCENTAKTPSSLKIDQIKSVLAYIEENYATPMDLEKLAKILNMNSRYFCRFSQSIMHVSPIAYVTAYRIEKAGALLQNTSLSVLQICMESGFNDCSHFIKVFKKYKGCTPNQYRKSK